MQFSSNYPDTFAYYLFHLKHLALNSLSALLISQAKMTGDEFCSLIIYGITVKF